MFTGFLTELLAIFNANKAYAWNFTIYTSHIHPHNSRHYCSSQCNPPCPDQTRSRTADSATLATEPMLCWKWFQKRYHEIRLVCTWSRSYTLAKGRPFGLCLVAAEVCFADLGVKWMSSMSCHHIDHFYNPSRREALGKNKPEYQKGVQVSKLQETLLLKCWRSRNCYPWSQSRHDRCLSWPKELNNSTTKRKCHYILIYPKVPEISPEAQIFQRIIFGGAYLRTEICVTKSVELAL